MTLRLPAFLFCLLAALLSQPSQAQTAAPLTGTVVDASTKTAVPFASLAVPGQPGGTVSNAEGAFQLMLPAGADSVRVQALGFAPVTLAVKALAPGAALTVSLKPQPYTLQEVVVTAFATPATLLKQAVSRTTARMASPLGLQAYYREFTVYNGQVAKFADALVDYYLEANPRRPHNFVVQARVQESRAGEAALSADDASRAIPSPITIDRAANYYDVTEKNPYLDSTKFKFYTYTLLETPAGAAATPYYEVRCTPATQDPEYLRQATIRIDRRTLAIQQIESEVPARLQPYLTSINLIVVKAKLTQYRKRIDYREFNGRLYPSFVRLQIMMDITKSGEVTRYDFTSDMLVRGLNTNPAPFPKNEQYSGSLYKRGTQYSRPYWGTLLLLPPPRKPPSKS
jgi:hypothetical protein